MFGLKESEDELFAEYLLHKYNTDQSELDRFYTVWDLLLEKKLFLEFPEQFALSICYPNEYPENSIDYSFIDISLESCKHEFYDCVGHKVFKGIVNDRGLQGTIETYHDGELFMQAEYSDNIKQGKCLLFNHQMCIFEGTYKNGYKEGLAKEYNAQTKKYVLIQYEGISGASYRAIDEDQTTFIQKEFGGTFKSCCYSLAYDGGCNQFREEGHCFEWNEKTQSGQFSLLNYDSNGCPIYTVLRALQANEMSVKAHVPVIQSNDATKVCWEERECYKGEFEENAFIKQFPRNGRGLELFTHPIDGSFIWKLYGTFYQDELTGSCQLLNEDEFCVCNMLIEKGTIQTLSFFDASNDYALLNQYTWDAWNPVFRFTHSLDSVCFHEVAHFVVPDGTNPTLPLLDLSSFVLLKTIQIGNNCFSNTTAVYVYHLPFLQRIEIGNNCFQSQLTGLLNSETISSLPSSDQARVVSIQHCRQLKTVIIGRNCFPEFSHVDISENPSLTHLQLGTINPAQTRMDTVSFYNVQTFILQQLPSLTELCVGDYSFMNTIRCVIKNLPHLLYLCNSRFPEYPLHCCFNVDLPALEEFEFEACFNCFSLGCYTDLPGLRSIRSHRPQHFTSLSSLHILQTPPIIHKLAGQNPIETPIIEHHNTVYLDPFHCIHFDERTSRGDYDDDGSYWDGSWSSEGYPEASGLKVEEDYTTVTSMHNGKMNGWTQKYKNEVSGFGFFPCLQPANLVEECCYWEDSKHGLVTTYLGNGTKHYQCFYRGKQCGVNFMPSHFQDRSVMINTAFMQEYRQTLLSSTLHAIAFSKDWVTVQCLLNEELVITQAVVQTLVLQCAEKSSLPSVILSNLPRLTQVVVESNTFVHPNCCGAFRITNCPLLQTLTIKPHSCLHFTAFLLSEVSQLHTLSIGSLASSNPLPEDCFSGVNAFMIPHCSLQQLNVGDGVFTNVQTFKLGCMIGYWISNRLGGIRTDSPGKEGIISLYECLFELRKSVYFGATIGGFEAGEGVEYIHKVNGKSTIYHRYDKASNMHNIK